MARRKAARASTAPPPWAGLTVVEINGAPWVVAPAVVHTPVLGPFSDEAAAWRWIERNDENDEMVSGGGRPR